MNNEQLKSMGVGSLLLVFMMFGQCVLHQGIAQAELKGFEERMQELEEVDAAPAVVPHKPEESVKSPPEPSESTDSSFKMINALVNNSCPDGSFCSTEIVDFQYSEGITACGNLRFRSGQVCISRDEATNKDTLVIGDVTIPKEPGAYGEYCFELRKDSSGQTCVRSMDKLPEDSSRVPLGELLSIRGKCGDREFVLRYKIVRMPGAKERGRSERKGCFY